MTPLSPARTVYILEKSRIKAKKVPVEMSDDPEEKTALVPVSKTRLKFVQKFFPESVKRRQKPVRQPLYYEIGKASFYTDKLKSRKTASGEPFNQKAKTAAHNQLPFGTKVKVTNKQNKKSVIVTINDRGSFGRGRIIDLSRFAFSRIGDTRDGVLDVEIEIIDRNDLSLNGYAPDQS
ncbi:septal ring lytic transglycosylase RlpA family protein [Desulfobacter postgatei]|uniref:septal ring lytic transglycosylase RlpA family protein n=1 Tax=Desulfobacter postgatei TaxID=2293 RepID=UPI002A362C4C|nr:septal ring lytic transglycosylase RlpA family protein [Desulfobacter postgatei]MDX9962174.1 septal ring lytic transglycosylase RlpA family protein [Desulfobacter postgatei]